MRQSEKNKQNLQPQFNIATEQLFSQFDYGDIKPVIDDLLLGWISSNYFELIDTSNRAEILDFFNRSLLFLEKVSLCYWDKKEQKEFPFDEFDKILTPNFKYTYKKVKKYFKITLKYYLETDFSNDALKRSDTIFKVKQIKKYFKKIYKIKTEFN